MIPSPSEIEELLARLRAFTGEIREFRKVRRNPDGPNAAACIEALLADRKALLEAVEGRDQIIAEVRAKARLMSHMDADDAAWWRRLDDEIEIGLRALAARDGVSR